MSDEAQFMNSDTGSDDTCLETTTDRTMHGDAEIILDIACEGGGTSIYRCRMEGRWTYMERGSSWGLDANDEEVVNVWESKPVSDPAVLLPKDWPVYFSPIYVHPDYEGLLRDLLVEHLTGLESGESQAHVYRRWREILARES